MPQLTFARVRRARTPARRAAPSASAPGCRPCARACSRATPAGRPSPGSACRGSRGGRRPASRAPASSDGPSARPRSSRTGSRRVCVCSRSVTAKRPSGVSLPGRPTAIGIRRTTRLPRLSVSRRRDRLTWIEMSVAPSRAAAARIHPRSPFLRSVAITRSQPSRRPVTASTRCEPNSVRVPSRARMRPCGAVAQRRALDHARGLEPPRRPAGLRLHRTGSRGRGLGHELRACLLRLFRGGRRASAARQHQDDRRGGEGRRSHPDLSSPAAA